MSAVLAFSSPGRTFAQATSAGDPSEDEPSAKSDSPAAATPSETAPQSSNPESTAVESVADGATPDPQTEDPSLAAEEEISAGKARPGLFHLNQLDGYLELGGSYEQSRVRNRNNNLWSGFRQENRETRFDETLGLSFDLDVVDPAFLRFRGDVGFGLRQTRFQEETEFYGDDDNHDDYITSYDLQLDILQNKQVSGSVYGRKSEDRIARRFLSSLQEDRTEWGTNWVYKSEKFPMRLNYFHRETDRTENRDSFDNEHLIEDSLRWEGDWIISENQTLKLAYEFGDQQQDYQGSNFEYDTQHHEFSLDYDLSFGAAKAQKSWDGVLAR